MPKTETNICLKNQNLKIFFKLKRENVEERTKLQKSNMRVN